MADMARGQPAEKAEVDDRFHQLGLRQPVRLGPAIASGSGPPR
jgi:hypothetical protein